MDREALQTKDQKKEQALVTPEQLSLLSWSVSRPTFRPMSGMVENLHLASIGLESLSHSCGYAYVSGIVTLLFFSMSCHSFQNDLWR